MNKTVTIEPMTRIEGHLKVETDIVNGKVDRARIAGEMFRGFEHFLLNRNPVDAARITQRVCGVCHEVHGIASMLALEQLYGITPPPNGKLLRDMILGLHLITDHILHFYTLSLPDYIDFTALLKYNGGDPEIKKLREWVTKSQPAFILRRLPGTYIEDASLCLRAVANYVEAIQIRRIGGSGMALLGAKVPFTHALMPGGVTTPITTDRLMAFKKAVDTVMQFVKTAYLPDALAVAGKFPGYFNIGVVPSNHFYAHQAFESLGTPLFKAGVRLDGKRQPFDPKKVSEDLGRSYYNDDGSPNHGKAGAYSWTKSPRYDGRPMETGPLARMVINQHQQFVDLMARLNQPVRSSVMGRIIARAVESEIIGQHLYKLIDAYKFGEPNIVDFDVKKPVSAEGHGYSIAARGALSHHISAQNGVITRYNLIVPSTWNFGPGTGNHRGIAEQALIGTPVTGNAADSIEVGRVIRSFDPCTACSVH